MCTDAVFFKVLLSGWLLCIACNDGRSTAKDAVNESKIASNTEDELNITLSEVLDVNAPNAITRVNVDYDQYFKSPKRYLGFSLAHLIDSTWKASGFDTASAIVVFECRDGYNPITDLSRIYGPAKGFIVFKDIDQPGSRKWPDSISQQFNPYYLVWDHVKKNDESYFWPYGLTTIRLISQKGAWRSIYPSNDPEAKKGFIAFRDNCMKCHSINRIGGTVGPEFNIPKNITEYWDVKQIIAFAKAPTSYRYNSHMPAMTAVSDTSFENIIHYLKYMKDHKNNH